MDKNTDRIQQMLAGMPGLAEELAGKATAEQLRILAKPGIASPVLVRTGMYQKPPAAALTARLRPRRARIRRVLGSGGRVNFGFHRLGWGGTGWMIAAMFWYPTGLWRGSESAPGVCWRRGILCWVADGFGGGDGRLGAGGAAG